MWIVWLLAGVILAIIFMLVAHTLNEPKVFSIGLIVAAFIYVGFEKMESDSYSPKRGGIDYSHIRPLLVSTMRSGLLGAAHVGRIADSETTRGG